MQKIHLKQEVIDSINFLVKIAESYFGSSNAARTYQPHVDTISKAIVDEPEQPKQEPEQK